MSDPTLDELAESARNRGLKLVRSRVRTPGKRRFGKVGLTDARGKPVFGMDAKGPTAKPEDVEHYLRNVGAKDWGASLDVAVLPRKRKAKPARQAANDVEPKATPKRAPPPPPPPPPPKPKPKPKPEPKRKIRDAKTSDAARLVELIRYLGHEIDEKAVRKNLGKLKKTDETPLVATLEKSVVGLIGIHRMVTVHRPAPVGRITVLVVAKEVQDHGIGRMLVEAAEAQLRNAGCQIVEVTSNDRRTAAHAFYRHLGYERTSMRFMKTL
ncbi:MAG TPA: GNAT family N-acetyltransferase [Sphingomicrobium sp.]|nr:GNAT family N-acetyltransferase [Sphingomicrobium sp.]